jgi:hypothetical protein
MRMKSLVERCKDGWSEIQQLDRTDAYHPHLVVVLSKGLEFARSFFLLKIPHFR